MTKVCVYLHEACKIIHCDLHRGNWLIRENGEIALGDFGCSRVLPDGVEPAGTLVHYAFWAQAPEMDIDDHEWDEALDVEKITQHLNRGAKSKQDFSFNSDMFCLGGTFRAMVNGGDFHANDNTINLGQDVVELIDWMRTPD
jgi:serine/threonine protein kinase